MKLQSIAIIGGGHAGDELIGLLREQDFKGDITLFDASTLGPYERPPLSKGFLQGDISKDSLSTRSPAFYDRVGVQLRRGVTVELVEVSEQGVRIIPNQGPALEFDAVVVATGMAPRQLAVPGSTASGIHYLQSLEDAVILRDALLDAASVVVLGGGFIGSESASSINQRGLNVTLIESGSRLMKRAVSEAVSHVFQRQHEAAGVRLMLNSGLVSVSSEDGRVVGVQTIDGENIQADLIVASIGVRPRTEFLDQTGIVLQNGFVVVDEEGRSSHPRVFAAGDVALFPNPRGVGEPTPIPSVDNASWSANIVVRGLLGTSVPEKRSAPTFWTKQYGLEVQIAGLIEPRDHSVIRGNEQGSSFSVMHYFSGKLVAIEAVAAQRDYQAGAKAISEGYTIPPEVAVSSDVDLSDLVFSTSQGRRSEG